MSPIGGLKSDLQPPGNGDWRDRWYHIIFEADTVAGKTFDLSLLAVILFYLVMNSLQTVDSIGTKYDKVFTIAEWICTILFTVEYALRIACVKRPIRYITSFYGLVDLLSILPTYCIFILGSTAQSFGVIRALRLLRVFRVLKLAWLTKESEVLWKSVWDARGKVVVFLFVVVISVTIAGTLMFEIEGRHIEVAAQQENPTQKESAVPAQSGVESLKKGSSLVQHSKADDPAEDSEEKSKSNESSAEDVPQPLFDSIPSSIYWAIVTMTTVGYGDIVPKTVLGKFVASLLILLGYSLIIVPTGFVSAEISKNASEGNEDPDLACDLCPEQLHQQTAKFCQACGQRLVRKEPLPDETSV